MLSENIQKARHAALRGLLSPQPKTGDQGTIPLDILVPEVLEESSTLADQHQETSPAVMVLLIDLQMLGEMADAFGEHCNLDLGRTRIRVVQPIFFNYCLRVFHAEIPFERRKRGRTSGNDCSTQTYAANPNRVTGSLPGLNPSESAPSGEDPGDLDGTAVPARCSRAFHWQQTPLPLLRTGESHPPTRSAP